MSLHRGRFGLCGPPLRTARIRLGLAAAVIGALTIVGCSSSIGGSGRLADRPLPSPTAGDVQAPAAVDGVSSADRAAARRALLAMNAYLKPAVRAHDDIADWYEANAGCPILPASVFSSAPQRAQLPDSPALAAVDGGEGRGEPVLICVLHDLSDESSTRLTMLIVGTIDDPRFISTRTQHFGTPTRHGGGKIASYIELQNGVEVGEGAAWTDDSIAVMALSTEFTTDEGVAWLKATLPIIIPALAQITPSMVKLPI